jgi:hypothetical protein
VIIIRPRAGVSGRAYGLKTASRNFFANGMLIHDSTKTKNGTEYE